MTTTPTPELLANLFRIEVFDQLSLTIADRLAGMLGGENVELEAKLGSFHIKGDPYRFPDLEAGFYTLAYNPQPLYKFVSEVQQQQFDFLRKMVLNGRIENYRLYRHDPEIKYIQTHTIDSMYTSPDDPTATIRVTRNLDGEVLACISKQEALATTAGGLKLGSHINVLNNSTNGLDFRISVKRETPVDLPHPDLIPFYTRTKIRSSYQVGMFSIDLTELPFQDKHSGVVTTTYEIEIEFLPQYMAMLRQSLSEYAPSIGRGVQNSNESNNYENLQKNSNFVKIIRSLIQTIQTLIKFTQPSAKLPLLCRVDKLSEQQLKKLKPFDINKSSAVVSLNQGGLAGESRM